MVYFEQYCSIHIRAAFADIWLLIGLVLGQVDATGTLRGIDDACYGQENTGYRSGYSFLAKITVHGKPFGGASWACFILL